MVKKTFKSTRGASNLSFKDCLLSGFAPDGGLVMPEVIPRIGATKLLEMASMSYKQLVVELLCLFVDESELGRASIERVVGAALSEELFGDEPVGFASKQTPHIVELWHGPTFAFKDYGLQVIANMMEEFLGASNDTVNLLVATSGDTGSAALAAFENKKHASLTVLYPHGKVSHTQQIQMTSFNAPNLKVFAVDNATSDSLDTLLYTLFNDKHDDTAASSSFSAAVRLGSVNSFNICRILVQMAHFFYAYFRHRQDTWQRVTFALPTGAFGNAISGYLAKQMGLPIELLVCNGVNDVSSTFFQTGLLQKRDAKSSIAPAIDICAPYNIERYLFYLCNENVEQLQTWMQDFDSKQGLQLPENLLPFIQNDFQSASVNDEMVENTIKQFYSNYQYVLDPHTAVAVACVEKLKLAKDQVVVCATASPHKFLPIVTSVLGDDALTPHPKLSHLATAANHAIAIDMNDKTQCLSAIRQQITELASFLVNDQ